MNLGDAPKQFRNLGINTDTVHLMALNDQLQQMMLWATAAQKTVQVLLAKRAPEPEPVADVSIAAVPAAPQAPVVGRSPVSTSSGKVAKAELMRQGLTLGIPEDVLNRKQYLNGGSRPTEEGYRNTVALLHEVKSRKEGGKDLSGLW